MSETLHSSCAWRMSSLLLSDVRAGVLTIQSQISMMGKDREGREAQMYTVRFSIGSKYTFTSGIAITIPPVSPKRALLNRLSNVTY